jgi:hypothetical protein
MATTDLDDIPWPPNRDDPRIEILKAENEALRAELVAERGAHAETRIELEQVIGLERDRCLELARLQEECPPDVLRRVYGESSTLPPDHDLTGPQPTIEAAAEGRTARRAGPQERAARSRARPR